MWHPYAPLPAETMSLPVVGASGVRLRLAGGEELIDGMASWWCAIHGYRHPKLDEAVNEQLSRFAHVMFGGLVHEPAVRLAGKLVALTPEGLSHVFFADSGSVAVEVAVKMCLQAQRSLRDIGASKLLTVRGGYHGDTFGAMALCDPVDGMHRLFTGALAEHVFAPRPPAGFDVDLDVQWAAQVSDLVAEHASELAGVIVEPVVQGAGGMRFYSPQCLALLRALCDEHGLLLIFDEIATGFGRTGAMFACEHGSVRPDIMCVGKALSAGYLTLAATLCTSRVAEAIGAGEAGALMHGPTFMANALACSVALASLELLEEGAGASMSGGAATSSGGLAISGGAATSGGGSATSSGSPAISGSGPATSDGAPIFGGALVSVAGGSRDTHACLPEVRRIEAGLRHGLAPARELTRVRDVRVLGAIGVIEMDQAIDVAAVSAAAVRCGVWLRPFRNLIYAMPPYVIDDGDLAAVCAGMLAGAQAAA